MEGLFNSEIVIKLCFKPFITHIYAFLDATSIDDHCSCAEHGAKTNNFKQQANFAYHNPIRNYFL